MQLDVNDHPEDLSLGADDDVEIELDSGVDDQIVGKIELCLVGRLLTGKPINFNAMRSRLAEIWRPVKGIHIKDLHPNLFLFLFFHSRDLQRVIDGGLWFFYNCPLVFKRL
ncbi:hypothetical protein PTKIN_Ptkin10aG0078000 [Pterospermum kingtungense]